MEYDQSITKKELVMCVMRWMILKIIMFCETTQTPPPKKVYTVLSNFISIPRKENKYKHIVKDNESE